MKRAIPRFQPNIPFGELVKSLGRAIFCPNKRGEITAQFENRFAQRIGSRAAIAISSVRFGIYHTLRFLNFPNNSEILCTPLTIYPIIETVILAGLKPVFVDIKPGNFSLDVDDAKRKLTNSTRAILVTHLWGIPGDMAEISRFAEQNGLMLLEDASHCLNGQVGGKKVGTFGKAGFFSFITTKTINTYHGAMMVTDDEKLKRAIREEIKSLLPVSRTRLLKFISAEFLLFLLSRRLIFSWFVGPLTRFLKKFGFKDRLEHRSLSPSKRLKIFPDSLQTAFTDIQAKTGLRMLEFVEQLDSRRREIARRYIEAFNNIPQLELPRPGPNGQGNYWMFAVCTQSPEKLKDYLWERDRIDSASPSIDPCHEMAYFEGLCAELRQASRLSEGALYLPAYPSLRDEEVLRVVKAVQEYFQDRKAKK